MLFGLTAVPPLQTGQELSAQDLNNLMQNASFIEQIAKGPNKLFLAHWRFAPPYFRLLNYNNSEGNLDDSNTYNDRFFISQKVSNLEVWEGSFLYRTGMKRLKLAFQTYPLKEPKTNTIQNYRYLDGIDLADIDSTYYGGKNTFVDEDISLYLILRYTDVPLGQVTTNEKYRSFVRRWSYARNASATHPGTSTPSYKFSSSDGAPFVVGSANTAEYWIPNTPQLSSQGYHQYELDLSGFNFVPGEIVTVKFRLGKASNIKPWESRGTSYYFSMVYAYVEHNLVPFNWQTLNSISSLADVITLAANQRYLVERLRKYDVPLRAALWDQITANASYASAYSQYNDEWRSFLERFGLDTDVEFIKSSVFAEEARYYFQKQFTAKDTLRLVYNVATNPGSAFNLQTIIPYNASSPSSYKIPRKTLRGKQDLLSTASNIPEWQQVADFNQDYLSGSTVYNNSANQYPPLTAEQSFLTYRDDLSLISTDITDLRVKRGLVRFYGAYQATYKKVSTAFFAGQNLYTGLGYGYAPLTTASLAPAGFLVGDAVFLSSHANAGAENFGGFYFLRPSVLDGGVPYYSAESSQPLGLSTGFFLGSRFLSSAYSYSDIFNFTFVPTTSNKYIPALYANYINGLSTSALGYTNGGYTNVSVQVKESALTVKVNSPDPLVSYTQAYNKASYIGLLRLTEMAMFKSDYVVSSFPKLASFTPLAYSGLLNYLNQVNTLQNEAYAAILQDDVLKHTPLFWTTPKSVYRQYEKLYLQGGRNNDLSFTSIESDLLYFSQTRQADYLIVRGKNVTIGWNGFDSIYRDNPQGFFPGDLSFEFVDSQSIIGEDYKTVVIGFDSLKSLNYGQRYYLQGTVQYAAETMELP